MVQQIDPNLPTGSEPGPVQAAREGAPLPQSTTRTKPRRTLWLVAAAVAVGAAVLVGLRVGRSSPATPPPTSASAGAGLVAFIVGFTTVLARRPPPSMQADAVYHQRLFGPLLLPEVRDGLGGRFDFCLRGDCLPQGLVTVEIGAVVVGLLPTGGNPASAPR